MGNHSAQSDATLWPEMMVPAEMLADHMPPQGFSPPFTPATELCDLSAWGRKPETDLVSQRRYSNSRTGMANREEDDN